MTQPQLGSFESIALAAIRPSGTNPRKHFDQLALDELTRSVEEMGVTQPLLLRPWPRNVPLSPPSVSVKFQIVSGERRYRASIAANRLDVPAIIRDLTDAEALDIQMIENLQRADLHPVEECDGYRALMASGATVEDVAKKAGKSVAYVRQRIQLQNLCDESRQIFELGHITLDHALLLARLTPKEQHEGLGYLLDIRQWEIKASSPLPKLIASRIDAHKETGWHGEPSGRLVKPTAPQLHHWIKENLLLALKGVPWDLGDATLLPTAGACTDCPKRTGANPALFSDLTTNDETCTDPACFAAKKEAFVQLTQVKAKEQGSPLLKLSSKTSIAKLETPAVELKPAGTAAKGVAGDGAKQVMKPVVVAKKTIREGQWVEAKKGSCPTTVQGILTDGPNQGKTRYVCVDQTCKVHKHSVEQPAPKPTSTGKASPETQKKAEAERALQQKIEQASEKAIMAAARGGVKTSHKFVERFLVQAIIRTWGLGIKESICDALGITVKGWEPGKPMNHQQAQAADKAVAKCLLDEASPVDLHAVAFELLVHDAWEDADEDEFDALAKLTGVDVDAIRNKVEQEIRAEAAEDAARPKLKDGVKKTPAKKPAKVSGKSAAAGERDDDLVEALDEARDEDEDFDYADDEEEAD